MQFLVFILVTFIWTLVHYYFLWLNEILKNADSFAYIQMARNLANFDISWFWTGWFGFIYSLPIALASFITSNLFFAAQIINLLLFALGWYFLYKISLKYLKWFYVFIPLVLYYTSSTLLSFNIQVLSENIYIPLFLWLVYLFQDFEKINLKKSLGISVIMALLYLTRAEAFIYLWSIFLIFLYIAFFTKIGLKKSSLYFTSIIIWFFILISPYIYYLHSITWEWSLTNKGSSNLRQATMRWIDKMDDLGFEKAVWELTPDKHHLMAGFAWWLKYDKSYSTWSTKAFLLDNPSLTINRILENQIKLYTKNIPNILAWDIIKKVFNEYKNKNYNELILFWIISFLFLFSFIRWFYLFIFPKRIGFTKGDGMSKSLMNDIENSLYKNYTKVRTKNIEFIIIFLSFFLTASFFFSIFFILDRYFVVFLPLAFIFATYFWQESMRFWWLIYITIPVVTIFSFIWFNNEQSLKDDTYSIKKEAGEWIKNNYKDNDILRIMERWPIVTYYSESPERWITPYTDKLPDIVKYATYNNIDLLIVDSLDFATYRPELKALLEWKDNYFWIEKVREFNNWNKKVIIYKFK